MENKKQEFENKFCGVTKKDIYKNGIKWDWKCFPEDVWQWITENFVPVEAMVMQARSLGVQNGGSWQKCPKCDGQGIVSKPPWVAGDVTEWTSTQTSYPCDLCGGMKVIKQ